MLYRIYGLKNCDSCRKAVNWMATQGLEYQFLDLRENALTRRQLENWLSRVDWEIMLNRRSTTWRQLDSAEREPLDAARATELMLKYPTLIKRPVLEYPDGILVGFTAAKYAASLPANR